MTQQHPITPPQWQMDGWQARIETMGAHVPSILLEVIQWGREQANADIERKRQEAADEELKACCQALHDRYDSVRRAAGFPGSDMSDWLRAARRPKPKSEKQQALEDLDALQADLANYGMGFKTTNIRRALESIPDNQ